MENSEIKKEGAKEGKRLSRRDFILVIVVILFLSGMTFWNFKTWRKSLKEVELPKFEMPKFEPLPKKEGHKDWISSDGKLKITYPADWIEMDKRVIEQFPQEKIKESKVLFVAQKFELENVKQAFLTVEELNIKEADFNRIIEIMQAETEKEGGNMEILSQKIGEKEAVFEANYKREGGLSLHSNEKLILAKEKFFLVSFFTFENYWSEFQKESEEILNSVQLVE